MQFSSTPDTTLLSLHKIGLKWFLEEGGKEDWLGLIPVYHRWIQQHCLDDVLVDVADYSHVHHGPGIMLIAHEGNYSMDLRTGNPGLQYYCKRTIADKAWQDVLRTVMRRSLQACALLEKEFTFNAKFSFKRCEFILNDRLFCADKENDLCAYLASELKRFFSALYQSDCTVEEVKEDKRERLMLTITALSIVDTPSAETLLHRLCDN